MDKFVTIIKPSTARTLAATAGETAGGKQQKQKPRPAYRYNPYTNPEDNKRQPGDWKEKRRVENLLAPLVKNGVKPTRDVLTKHLLNTLTDESNPITHSDIAQRSDYVTSTATGHQRSDGRGNHKPYLEARSKKLAEQLPTRDSAPETGVLRGVRVYIDGYLANSTDIEMKRIVKLAGGDVMYTASGATHILTSQQLSGSKTQKILAGSNRSIVHVVRPEWVTDSIAAGKRLPERTYSMLPKGTTKNLVEMLGAGSSRDVPIVLE